MQNIFANFKKKRNLEDKLKAKELSDVERFNNILKFANEILMEKTYEGKEHPIFDFIRILGRGLQSDYLKYVIYYDCKGGEYEVPDLCWDTIGFEDNMKIVGVNGESIDFYKLIKEIQCNKKLELSKDLILPWPWHRERLLSTIKNIGNGRLWGEWKQDYTNHIAVSYTHLRAHETRHDLVCRLLLEKK